MEGEPERQTITLYRIVWTNPPTARDVASNAALGRQPRGHDPDVLRLWSGISVFDTTDRARKQAQRRPWHGNAFIATLVIPVGVFRIEKTGGRGHYTLWGVPHAILEYVRHVERV